MCFMSVFAKLPPAETFQYHSLITGRKHEMLQQIPTFLFLISRPPERESVQEIENFGTCCRSLHNPDYISLLSDVGDSCCVSSFPLAMMDLQSDII